MLMDALTAGKPERGFVDQRSSVPLGFRRRRCHCFGALEAAFWSLAGAYLLLGRAGMYHVSDASSTNAPMHQCIMRTSTTHALQTLTLFQCSLPFDKSLARGAPLGSGPFDPRTAIDVAAASPYSFWRPCYATYNVAQTRQTFNHRVYTLCTCSLLLPE